MTAWFLPAAAAAVWAGILARSRLGGLAADPAISLGAAAGLLLVGLALAPRLRRGPGALARLGADAGPLAALGGRRTESGRRPGSAAACALVAAGALGVGLAGVQQERLEAAVLRGLAEERVELEATLRTDPRAGRFGWWAIARASSVAGSRGATSLSEEVWIRGDGPLPAAARGDRIRLACSIELPPADAFGASLDRRGVAAIAEASSIESLGPAGGIVGATSAVRDALAGSAGRVFRPREAGLLLGLAIGDDTGLDPGLERDFRATGLGHLLVVSGGNLAMVLAPLLGLATLLRVPLAGRFGLGLAAIAFFVVLTGVEPSVLRAGTMATLALIGVLLGRPRSTASALAGAVLLLLLVDPRLAWSIAFQLSVAATAGMVALAGPIADRLGWLPAPLAVATGATVGAQAGVLPLLLFHFHDVPLVALAANVLAFPAVAPAMLGGLFACGLELLWHPAGAFAARLAGLPLRYLEAVADALASAPVARITSGGGSAVLALGVAAVVGLVWWVRVRRPLPGRALLAAGLIAPLLVWALALRAGPPGELVVRFFDVGQGDAALISTPEGAHVLIDGGPEEEPVATKLAALGVKRLDVVVASHAHADHVVGLPTVFARFPVGVVLEPGCPGDSEPYLELLASIEEERLEVRRPRTGDAIRVGGLRLDVLSPSACWSGTESDPNNDSLVLRATYQGHAILFATEPEEPAQEAVLGLGADLTAEVLKVPHHGARTSVPEFFEAVDADLAVVSVGPNPYGHPVAEVLDWIRAAGARVLRTDRLGDVVIRFGPEGARVG